MKCQYCGQDIVNDETSCKKCGAPIQAEIKQVSVKAAPFYFHGFMIWPEARYTLGVEEYHIWAGDKYLGSFLLSRITMQAWAEENQGMSDDPLLYKLLRLALQETDFEKYEQKTERRRLLFTITRHDEDSDEWKAAREFVKAAMVE